MQVAIVVLATCFLLTSASGEVIINQKTGDDLDVCSDTEPCVNKCCPEDNVLVNKTCTYSPTYIFKFGVYSSTDTFNGSVKFNILHDKECLDGDLELSKTSAEGQFYIQKSGHLLRSLNNDLIPFDQYCIDTSTTNGDEIVALVCKIPDPESNSLNSLDLHYGDVILNHNTGDNPKMCRGEIPCIKKCCPENYVNFKKNCTYSPTKFDFKAVTDTINHTVRFNVLHGKQECPNADNLKLETGSKADSFYIHENGSLIKPFDPDMPHFTYVNYCVDIFVNSDGKKEFSGIVCYTEEPLKSEDSTLESEDSALDSKDSPVANAKDLHYGDVILNHNTGDNPKICRGRVPCIKKCCPKNTVSFKKNCTYSPTKFDFKAVTDTTNHTVRFNVLHGRQECPNADNLKLETGSEVDSFYIHENGSLIKPFDPDMPLVTYVNYCLDIFVNSDGKEEFSGIVCYTKELLEQEDSRVANAQGMIISMPFLLITFLVYLILPDSNLHRKALMSYVFALLAAYITLVTIQLYTGKFPDVPCHLLGYLIIFFFLVSFFWMNVMCIDMWLAFSGMRTVMSKKTAERKRFIIYCVYAWGMPIIHVGIVLLLNTHAPEDAGYHPHVGNPRCFLGDGMPTFYYFYLPMAILIGINIVLFILTTVRIQKVKRETSMLKQTESKKSYEDDKQQFNLYLKLMFAMGINWIMELISWVVDQLATETPSYVWYLTDFTNAMYGVLIFIIFVFKKKTWQTLKKRYYVFIGKPHLAHSMTTSSARGTRTSNYSTTDTAVSTDYRLSDMKKNPEESALTRT